MTIWYISGPMRAKPEFNHPQFGEVERALAAKVPVNDQIINPAHNFNGDTTRLTTEYLNVDLRQVLEADVIVLLPEWHTSEGASREVQVATWAGKKFWLAEKYGNISDMADWHWTFTQLTEPPTPPMSLREQSLRRSIQYITGDRNNQYGPPTQDFRRTADAMSAYGYRHTNLPLDAPPCSACGARRVKAHDIAIAVDCVKTSRIMWSPKKADHWDDKQGYSACGYECAMTEDD